MVDKKYYFAYGSNMDIRQMRGRCPGSEALGPGVLRQYRFVINTRGVATIVPVDAGVVHGILWQITPADEDRLDRYEGVAEGLYWKEPLDIERPRGESIEAFGYMAADSLPGKPRKGYLQKIVQAAVDHTFPEAYIQELQEWSKTAT